MMFKKICKKKRISSNSRGFSFVGSILGFSLLGVSTAGLATYMGNFKQVQVQYTQQSNEEYVHFELLDNMRNVITEIKTSDVGGTDESIHGLCDLVSQSNVYNDLKGQYFDNIEVDPSYLDPGLSGGGSSMLSNARWKYFMQTRSTEWKLVDSSECSNNHGFITTFSADHLKKCLKKANTGEGSTPVYARVSLKPVKLPEFSMVAIENDDKDRVSVDLLGFELQTIVSRLIAGTEEWTVSQATKLVLASEVGSCQICEEGSSCLNAFLYSGAMSNSLKETVYHNSFESHLKSNPQNLCKGLGLESKYVGTVSNLVVQSGKKITTEGRVILENDIEKNVAMSCTTNLYKCGNTYGASDDYYFDPHFRLQFLLNINLPDRGYPVAYLKKLGVKLKKDDQEQNPRADLVAHSLRGVTFPIQKTDGSMVEYSTGKPDSEAIGLSAGSSHYSLLVNSDRGVCRNICAAPGAYHPELHIALGSQRGAGGGDCSEDFPLDGESNRPNAKVACTVCHMKSCHRSGLGAFGPIANLPSEPYDGNIPECLASTPVTSVSESKFKIPAGDLTPGSMLKVNASKELSEVSTSELADGGTLPTICFINGKYTVVNRNYTGVSDMGYGADACYHASYQKANIGNLSTTGLVANLAIAYDRAPSSRSAPKGVKEILQEAGLPGSSSYHFYNSATQGLFLLPLNQSIALTESALVSYQVDQSGMIMPGWPYMSDGVLSNHAEKQWAFFYREPYQTIDFQNYDSTLTSITDATKKAQFKNRIRPSRPLFLQLPTGSDNLDYPRPRLEASNPGSTERCLMLTHHIHYKGLREVPCSIKIHYSERYDGYGVREDMTYPFLCKMNGKFYISEEKSRNFLDGYDSCGDASFSPPMSPKEWVSALMAVAPNDPRQPFPNPFNFADGQPSIKEGSLRMVRAGGKNLINFELDNSNYLNFNYDETDFNRGYNTDNLFLVKPQDTTRVLSSRDSIKILGPVKSAWVGVSSRKGVTGSDLRKKSSNWHVNLAKLFPDKVKSSGSLTDASVYAIPSPGQKSIQDIFHFAEGVVTPGTLGCPVSDGSSVPLCGLGFLDRYGKMGDLSSLQNNLDKKYRPCRFTNTVSHPYLYKAPLFRGDGTTFPNSCYENSKTASIGSGSLYNNSSTFDFTQFSLDNSKIADMHAGDMADLVKGVRSSSYLLDQISNGREPILNKTRFCAAIRKDRIRKKALQCLVSKYDNSNVYSQTQTCRQKYNEQSCQKFKNDLANAAESATQCAENCRNKRYLSKTGDTFTHLDFLDFRKPGRVNLIEENVRDSIWCDYGWNRIYSDPEPGRECYREFKTIANPFPDKPGKCRKVSPSTTTPTRDPDPDEDFPKPPPGGEYEFFETFEEYDHYVSYEEDIGFMDYDKVVASTASSSSSTTWKCYKPKKIIKEEGSCGGRDGLPENGRCKKISCAGDNRMDWHLENDQCVGFSDSKLKFYESGSNRLSNICSWTPLIEPANATNCSLIEGDLTGPGEHCGRNTRFLGEYIRPGWYSFESFNPTQTYSNGRLSNCKTYDNGKYMKYVPDGRNSHWAAECDLIMDGGHMLGKDRGTDIRIRVGLTTVESNGMSEKFCEKRHLLGRCIKKRTRMRFNVWLKTVPTGWKCTTKDPSVLKVQYRGSPSMCYLGYNYVEEEGKGKCKKCPYAGIHVINDLSETEKREICPDHTDDNGVLREMEPASFDADSCEVQCKYKVTDDSPLDCNMHGCGGTSYTEYRNANPEPITPGIGYNTDLDGDGTNDEVPACTSVCKPTSAEITACRNTCLHSCAVALNTATSVDTCKSKLDETVDDKGGTYSVVSGACRDELVVKYNKAPVLDNPLESYEACHSVDHANPQVKVVDGSDEGWVGIVHVSGSSDGNKDRAPFLWPKEQACIVGEDQPLFNQVTEPVSSKTQCRSDDLSDWSDAQITQAASICGEEIDVNVNCNDLEYRGFPWPLPLGWTGKDL